MTLPDLFQDVVDPSVKVGDRGFRSLPVSVLLHAAGLAAIVLIALAATDVLPTPPAVFAFVATPELAPAPPPPPAPLTAARKPMTPAANPAAAPLAAPAEIKPETGLEFPMPASMPGGVEGGIPGGVTGAGMAAVPEPPAPPPAPKAPIRVGGMVRPPVKVKDVAPMYPELAIRARVQGVVVVEADLDERGRVTDARILRSIPLLDRAALDAVRQWEYAPTLLNGVPTPIVMVVTVTFQFARPGAETR